jgi:hypothetical protein
VVECLVLPLLVGAALFYLLNKWIEEAPLPPDESRLAPREKIARQAKSREITVQQAKWTTTVEVTHRFQQLMEMLKRRDLEWSLRKNLKYELQHELTQTRTEQHHLRRYLKNIHRAHEKIAFSIAPSRGRLQMEQIGFGSGRGRPFILVLTRNELIVYPESPEMREYHVFGREQLRWFGHPEAEQLWLHFERNGRWWVLRMALGYDDKLRVLAALRDFAPGLMPPYHRGLHVHYDPVSARRAEQEITGEWTLYEQRTLYLMPLYVVVLNDNTVQDALPVESITHVASVPRLDAPGGVVRFRVAGEDLAFALDDYEAFAVALAEAAKRSLDAPLEIVERKGKKGKAEA